MSIWATLAGAFFGTLVLTTVMRAASELKLTRMDLPFLLGTAATVHHGKAMAIGYVMHFASPNHIQPVQQLGDCDHSRVSGYRRI